MSLARCGGRVSSYTVITNTVMAVVTSVEQQIAEGEGGRLRIRIKILKLRARFWH